MSKKRVVVTGIGCICSIGNNAESFWNNLKTNKIGIDFIKGFDTTTFPIKIAAEVDLENNPDLKKEYEKFGYQNKGHFLGYKAAHEAVEHAQLYGQTRLLNDAGVSLGASSKYPDRQRFTTIAGFSIDGANWVENILDYEKKLGKEFIDKPFLFNRNTDTISRKIAKDLQLKGPVYTTQTACASSGNAIGNAYRAILHDEAAIMVTGGCDAMVTYLWMSAFAHLKALSPSKNPQKASIPFDVNRNGFVMGEGAAIIILEELEYALNRDAKIYGEIIGYGTSNNAFRITDSPIQGEQTALAIERAIKDADISKDSIDYICAHGTSTVQNDFAESNALRNVFGEKLPDIKINSIKHALGHTISASGAISVINTICSINENIIIPMHNIEKVDTECNLNIVREPTRCKIDHALINAFGFGGQNVSLVFKKFA